MTRQVLFSGTIINYIGNKAIVIGSPPAPPTPPSNTVVTSFRQQLDSNISLGNFNNSHRWDITSNFDIDLLRSEGYTHFLIILEYSAERSALSGLTSLRTSIRREINSNLIIDARHEVDPPALSTTYWLVYLLPINSFNNSLYVVWERASVMSSINIVQRIITIDAVKR